MLAGIVEGSSGMEYGLLCKVEHFGHVEGEFGRAFHTCFYFLMDRCKFVHADVGAQRTLNSFIMGTISSSKASFVTSPPRRSILLPTSITGT